MDKYIKFLCTACLTIAGLNNCAECGASKCECEKYWREELIPYIVQFGLQDSQIKPLLKGLEE